MPRVLFNFLIATAVTTITCALGVAQSRQSDQLQVAPPQMHRVQAPPVTWTAERLEQRADELRAQKAYVDSLDYYAAALAKRPANAVLQNKIGITDLQLQRFKDAADEFRHAIKRDKTYADAYNNLGVIYYLEKKYGKAIKQYTKALKLRDDSASFHSNLGTAYFSKKQFERATVEYGRALQLDPDIFERTSQSGVAAQMSSPEDRAHYDYVVAKMYARLGVTDRSLQYLRKALEDGYKEIDNVYKDTEFASLRKDPRFKELMSARPASIPE
jgi:tetratricopeptide (TPR) repeat protein